MEDTRVAQYSVIYDKRIVDKYNNITQGYSESLTDYAQRFKQIRDSLYHEVDMSISDCFAKTHKEYKAIQVPEERIEYLIAYREKSEACHFIQQSNNSYHQIKTDLGRAFALQNNLYPDNLNTAIEALTHYRTDYAANKRSFARKDPVSFAKHDPIQDDTKEPSSTSFFQENMRCFCCGSRGHSPNQCHKKDKTPKNKWWINTAEAPKTDSDDEDEAPTSDNDDESQDSQQWETVSASRSTKRQNKKKKHKQNHPSNFTTSVSSSKKYKTSFHAEHKNNIVLDTGCSVPALYCNPDLVYDIRPAGEPLCMATSTGMVYVNKKATVPVIGEVWYDPDQPTNLLSFGHMAERFKITHEANDDSFNLQMKNGDNLRFVKKNYLYTYTPSTLHKKTIKRMKQRRCRNKKHGMKTRSHTRSTPPVIGMSNLCLTHASANKRDPFNQSRFAGVPDSIGDRSDDDETNAEHGHYDADDNGTDSENGNNGTDS